MMYKVTLTQEINVPNGEDPEQYAIDFYTRDTAALLDGATWEIERVGRCAK